MQVKFLLGVLAGLSSVSAYGGQDEGYSKQTQGYGDNDYGHDGYGNEYHDDDYGKRKGYGNDNNDGYGNRKGYGYEDNDGYGKRQGYGKGNDHYDKDDSGYGRPSKGYGKNSGYGYEKPLEYTPPSYAPYQNHYTVDKSTPYPYTYFTSDHKKHDLVIPKLGDYHCFLTGAPWTTCGRKSLTSYFLDQCLVFYVQMSANVNGICGGKPPKPTPQPTANNDDYYSRDYHTPEPTPKPTPKPKPTSGYGASTDSSDDYDYEANYVDASSPAYLQEKCYQNSFVSITSATVMCLTENYIRINFIEHYAARACGNPIEGPILYLRKLHAFIDEVKSCTGHEALHNFPNLYRTFKTGGRTRYNPNAPYYLDGDHNVATYQYTSGEASGLAAYTVGNSFLCANTEELVDAAEVTLLTAPSGKLVYQYVPSTTHYSIVQDDVTKAWSSPYDSCKTSDAFKKLGIENQVRYCQNDQYTSDRTLRSLYDSVHYVEKKTTSLRRPLTIAEIAIRSAGVHEQPILEGFGIMYYCGFYACVANNNGDASKCYPEFKSEDDWKLPTGTDYSELLKKSREINECIDDGYLSNEDITSCTAVNEYTEALGRRSYLCLAENEIVSFYSSVYLNWAECDNNDADKWVYGRHLADERCWIDRNVEEVALCPSNSDLYKQLLVALGELSDICKDNKTVKSEPEPRSEPNNYGYKEQSGYHRNQYKQPTYGAKKY
ncbi:hypothetical protein THRCLA_01099 [Thraustotheca clavata]|uniref:Secreted protein n=1 Tax=Thraustotheca clavata TaxID=74557 RepID=A0A1W0AA24_9STRA|nr:hypothetical protein THRCLA_01099 [Thraustotheca clavata]